jgi:MoaA/NifB/PqqE/SkfB family radical SAM enzyme
VKVWADYQPWLDQPFEVSIETFSKCNATCTFCPYTQLERIGTKMPDELIDRLFGEMAEWKNGFGLSLFKVNEPLLDKRVLPLIERANREIPQAHPRLFSNGSTLTDVNVERIAGLKKLTHLWVSLNEYREEEYEKLMGISWKRTTENLDRLHERDFPHPVVLSCVGNPAPEFKAYCEKRWPKCERSSIRTTPARCVSTGKRARSRSASVTARRRSSSTCSSSRDCSSSAYGSFAGWNMRVSSC